MPWQKYEVRDSRSGITDIIRNSSPSFHEDSRNLVHDNKNGGLDQRPGTEYWADFDTPAKIRQLFQLEQFIFAYCYDDPVMPGDDIDGRFYWVYADGSSVAWTEVDTEGTTGTMRIRLRDEKNKGLDIEVDAADADFAYLWITKFTSSATNVPDISLNTGTDIVTMTVNPSRINAAGYFIRGDTLMELTYSDLKTIAEAEGAGWTVSYSPLTDPGDWVHMSDSFEPDKEDAAFPLGIGRTRGRFLDGMLPAFTKEGHVKEVKWQGHLYLSLEPFNKVFTANDDDPYAQYPDSFPPENDRLPLRKLYIVNEDTVTYPQLSSAQLPQAYVGYDNSDTTSLTSTDLSFRYAKVDQSIMDANFNEVIGRAIIWHERGIGSSPGNNQALTFYVQSFSYSATDEIDDWVDFPGGVQPPWGTFFVYFADGFTTVQNYVDRLSALIAKKAGSNPYGSPFNYIVSSEGIDSNSSMGGIGGITEGTFTSHWRNIPQDQLGTVSYVYGVSMRDKYDGEFEGAPREFLFDGPTQLLTFPSLGEIRDGQAFVLNSNGGTDYRFNKYPELWVGISKTFEYPTELYFDDHIVFNVYRTRANGSTSFLDNTQWVFEDIATQPPPTNVLYEDEWERDVGQTASFSDNLNDDDLALREEAYYNGGVSLYDRRPQGGGYYFTVVNQTGYYANIIGNIQRVYESPPGVPHASPSFNFQDFDDGVTGISHFSDKPIIFTQNTTWRWEGTFGTQSDGRTFIRVVSDEFGCIANQSIVRTNMGLFFWAKTGICFTNGLKALRVSEHLIDRYEEWLSYIQTTKGEIGPNSLRGFYDEINRRVLWSSLDKDGNPIYIVLDIFEGIRDEMPVFIWDGNTNYKWDGADYVITNQFQTSASLLSEDTNEFYKGQDTRVLTTNNDLTSDGYWDGTDVLEVPIKTEFKSVAIDYGHRRDRKWTSKVMYNFEDLTGNGVSLQPVSWNDLSKVPDFLGSCFNYQQVLWSPDYATFPIDTPQQFFRHTDVQWKSEHLVSYNRRFSKNRIRNVFKQVGWQPLPITIGEITEGAANVTDINVMYRSGTGRPLIEVTVDVSDTLDNAIIDLAMNNSGANYLKWDNQDEFVKVHDIELSGNTYTLQVFLGDEASNDYTYTEINSVTVGTVFAQQLKLSDYSLTFKLLSDTTHGIYKSEASGGDNG